MHSNNNHGYKWLALSILCFSFTNCQAAPQKAATTKAKQVAPAKTGTSQPLSRFKPAYDSYVNSLQPKVAKFWNYPDGQNHVILSVLLAADGSASDLKLVSTPANTAAEQSANDAFNQSQPLPALPNGSPPCRLTITFDSKADPHGEANSQLSIKLDTVAQANNNPAPTNNTEATPNTPAPEPENTPESAPESTPEKQ